MLAHEAYSTCRRRAGKFDPATNTWSDDVVLSNVQSGWAMTSVVYDDTLYLGYHGSSGWTLYWNTFDPTTNTLGPERSMGDLGSNDAPTLVVMPV